MGTKITDKDVIIADDMISSGDSMLEVAYKLKRKKAKNVYIITTFALFTNGIDNMKGL